MRRGAFLTVIVSMATLASSAFAAPTFSPVSWQSSITSSSVNFTSNGDKYKANLSGFNLNSNTLASELGWIFDWNDLTGFSSVTLTVNGNIKNGNLTVSGAEKDFDRSKTPFAQVGGGILNESIYGDSVKGKDFTITKTFDFSNVVKNGRAEKDILHFVTGSGALAQINSIEQDFHKQPVPEPVSIIALGALCGIVGLRQRRASKSSGSNT